MNTSPAIKPMMKGPLIAAAIVIVARVVLEQAGAPGWLSNLFSVVVLYVLIVPIYFAVRIAKGAADRPYRALLKNTALYATLARCMVIPTYWLAYHFQWTAPRFSAERGGNVGPNISPFMGYIGIPLLALAAWVIFSVVIGGGIGSIVIKLMRKKRALAAHAGGVPGN
jgi:hypothetical protein